MATADEPAERLLPGWLVTYLTGLAMGSADAVPGVSGGTIALIAGVYDRLVAAIAAFEPAAAARAVRQRSVRPILGMLLAMDVLFLIALGLGMVSGVVVVASVLEVALEAFRGATFAFFFGLIAASAVVLSDQIGLGRRREQVAAAAGFVLAFVLAGEQFRTALGHDPVTVFLAGGIAISAMILPGVSGSFLLIMLGQYEFMLATLSGFIDGLVGLVTGGGSDALAGPAVSVVAFCAGAGVGVLTFARVVEAALERDRQSTLTFMVALMVGALRLPVVEVSREISGTPGGVALVIAAALVGGGLVVGLDHYTGGLGYE